MGLPGLSLQPKKTTKNIKILLFNSMKLNYMMEIMNLSHLTVDLLYIYIITDKTRTKVGGK